LNTPLGRYNRSLSTLVSDCRSSAPKTDYTRFVYISADIYMYIIYMYINIYIYTSSAVNQHVTTRQQAADPARKTRLFPMSYQNNKHVIRLARSKPHIQILALSRLTQSNTVRILNNDRSSISFEHFLRARQRTAKQDKRKKRERAMDAIMRDRISCRVER